MRDDKSLVIIYIREDFLLQVDAFYVWNENDSVKDGSVNTLRCPTMSTPWSPLYKMTKIECLGSLVPSAKCSLGVKQTDQRSTTDPPKTNQRQPEDCQTTHWRLPGDPGRSPEIHHKPAENP